jgi:hypothetical protein
MGYETKNRKLMLDRENKKIKIKFEKLEDYDLFENALINFFIDWEKALKGGE